MSLSKKLTALSLSLMFVASVMVQANASEELFTALDLDQSGTISQTEASAHSGLSALFNEVDADSDGEITYAEFAAAGLEE
ncbi:EF-hand domain-containing protein [Glaciecola siphonariae]|uniref:EF-hand domain-containing protein n=1 Tax=Glaciecola siphonariae TaxID=521012 RepID=A0ABV9LWR0_9ALTE